MPDGVFWCETGPRTGHLLCCVWAQSPSQEKSEGGEGSWKDIERRDAEYSYGADKKKEEERKMRNIK
jgi:hypothetical protein